MLDTVHAVSPPPPTTKDYTPDTVTHLSSNMVMIQTLAMNIMLHPLFIQYALSGMIMTDAAGTTLPLAHPPNTPVMVIITLTLTDAAPVQRHDDRDPSPKNSVRFQSPERHSHSSSGHQGNFQ